MTAKEVTVKECGRCGHKWSSSIAVPARCPHCGTYHWQGESTEYSCFVCGHTWFSRTSKIPMRCPKCKTRSWQTGPKTFNVKNIDVKDKNVKTVMDHYRRGRGCVEIAMKTGIALSSVINIVKSYSGEGHPPRM